MEVVQMLYTEEVISNEAFDEVKRLRSNGAGPLRELPTIVSKDFNMPRVLATILLQSKDTAHMGTHILKEYGKC